MSQSVVLDVGNCAPDHASIKRMLLANFDVQVLQTDQANDTLALLRERPVDLILINRKLDCDYSDGTLILKQIKSDVQLCNLPIMIVTNYAEHQTAAVALGAEYGFGKLELQNPATLERLSKFLTTDREKV